MIIQRSNSAIALFEINFFELLNFIIFNRKGVYYIRFCPLFFSPDSFETGGRFVRDHCAVSTPVFRTTQIQDDVLVVGEFEEESDVLVSSIDLLFYGICKDCLDISLLHGYHDALIYRLPLIANSYAQGFWALCVKTVPHFDPFR